MDSDEQINNNGLSKISKDLSQESLLTLVAVRPPTPEKCAVCLNNKETDIIARIDSCSHTFCFSCILEWSKVRAICPLCKQPFTVITRERYSGDIVEEIRVQTPGRPARNPPTFTNLNEVLNWFDRNRRGSDNIRHDDIFRHMVYIEWLNTLEALVHPPNHASRNSTQSALVRSTDSSLSWSNIIPLASIRRLLHRYLHQTTSELRQSSIYSQSTRQTVAFRKYIYINRLFVRSPLIGHNHDTLSVRECSPTWYASNPACLHRLVPFLARELLALLWNDERTIEHIIQEILTTIQLHSIRSNILMRKLNEYLGRYTKHFIHEFYTFARCPYDLAGFDRHAQYPAMNSPLQLRRPMEILLDDDDINDGNEETPIVIDETTNTSIDTIDIVSSPQTTTTTEFERRSSSPECEIVEYVEPNIERTPTLIVLSEDDDDDDIDDDNNDDDEGNNESHTTISLSRKRKHSYGHNDGTSKQQHTSIIEIHSPTSVVSIDIEPHITNSIEEPLSRENNEK